MKPFTNLYQLTKTLKFKLEPQGETKDAKITKYFNYCYALPYYLPIFHGLTNVMSENLDISIILHTFALLF